MSLVVLLDFDGTAYRGDLAIQAYARRVAELLGPDEATLLIGGMRAFLEGKPPPAEMPPEFATAEDGYELIQAVADVLGVSAADRGRAYLASRDDLARSAFVLDPEPGLADWLQRTGATVWLVANAPLTGILEVLEAVGLVPVIDEITPNAGKPVGLAPIAARAVAAAGDARRVLAVGDRWAADLAVVHAVGGRTVHLDRFRRGLGTPTWRDTAFSPMLPALDSWAADPEGAPRAH